MRIVFCGSGHFAVPALRELLASDHDVACVVTQPARKAGRGANLRPTPVRRFAEQRGREVHECADINTVESIAIIESVRPDVLVVAEFGQMIRRPVRDLAPLGAMNLHASLLPELRGAAPVNWAVIRGCQRTGVTTISLVERMDAGPIFCQADTPVRPDETADELRDRLAGLGADLVRRTLGLLTAGWQCPRDQDESAATYAPKLKKSDGLVDWRRSAVELRNLIHGTWPWPGAQAAFAREGGEPVPVIFGRAEVAPGPAAAAPGAVDDDLCVATSAGRLRIRQIKPAGKRLMDWRDFANGYRVKPGSRFVCTCR